MRNKYTKKMIESAVKTSMCWADVCRKLGVQPMTGSQTHVKKRACDFNIDYSHFTGSGHKKGKTYEKRDALEYCFNGSTIISHSLKEKLIRDGYKKKQCEKCNRTEWEGQEIPLELDHIDSDHFNNEFKNLQILCPNCHAIKTSTDSVKNKKIIKKDVNLNKQLTFNFFKKRNQYKHNIINKCPKCGKQIDKRSKTCIDCYSLNQRKFIRPNINELNNDVLLMGYSATGRKYGVSDNTIRKWLK
jgi:hypothetical protein